MSLITMYLSNISMYFQLVIVKKANTTESVEIKDTISKVSYL